MNIKTKTLKYCISAISIFLLFVSCKETYQQKDWDEENKLKVVATTGMIGDAVQNILGEKGEVVTLMGPGVDPHLYKAAQSDLRLLQQADIIFYNGLHLEGKMADVLKKMSKTQPVYAITDGMLPSRFHQDSQSDSPDPHVWFNVDLWSSGVQFIGDKLSFLDADNETYYRNRPQSYMRKLERLHRYVTDEIQLIPENHRVMITAHDAFGYFGEAYGIEVKGIQGISTVAQAGLKEVIQLADLILKRKIPAVFVESSIPKRQVEALVEHCRDKGHDLKIGGTLYSDAMGAPDSEAGTYIGMVKHNVNTIVEALK